jgi:hypothetical protein
MRRTVPPKFPLELLIEAVTALHDTGDGADLSGHHLVETVAAQHGVHHILTAGVGDAHSHTIEVVDVGFQVLLAQVGSGTAYIVQQLLPVDVAALHQREEGLVFGGDLQEHHIAEREGAVGDHRLELHTEGLHLGAYLIKVGAPVQCRLWRAHHHLGHSPHLGHDLAADQRVDAAVVIVLGATAPHAQLGHRLAVEILRHEDAGTGYLGGTVTVEYLLHLLAVILLRGGLGAVSGDHGSHGLGVVVDTIPDGGFGTERHEAAED